MTSPAAVGGKNNYLSSPTTVPSKPKPATHLKPSSTMLSTPNGGGNDRKGKGPTTKRSYVSLDHLTNFQLPPRQQHPLWSNAPRRKKSSIAQQVWNKESEYGKWARLERRRCAHSLSFSLPARSSPPSTRVRVQNSSTHNTDS